MKSYGGKKPQYTNKEKTQYLNRDKKPIREARAEEKELPESYSVGRNAVKELLSSGRDIEKIYVQKGEREGSLKALAKEAMERKIPVLETERQKLDSLSGGLSHQGILAVASEHSYSSIDEIIEYAESRGEEPLIAILDGVEDPHNLGAIIRSAECCGLHGIIIPKRRAVGLTSVVSKASAGAIEYMRVAKVTNIAVTVDELKERGFWIYGADMGEKTYYETDMTGKAAIVLGSEGFGISRLVKEKCDFIVSIPLYGNVNSMNVSCAAAVLFAEAARQKNLSGGK